VTTKNIFFKNLFGSDRHLENRYLAITHPPIVRFEEACRQELHDKNCQFLKSKMADGRHFEILNPMTVT